MVEAITVTAQGTEERKVLSRMEDFSLSKDWDGEGWSNELTELLCCLESS